MSPWRSTPSCSRSSPARRTRARCSTSPTRTRLYNPRLQAPLRDPRRHPGHADRRGRRRSTTPSTSGSWPRPRPRASSPPSRPDVMHLDTLGMFDGAARAARAGRAGRRAQRRRSPACRPPTSIENVVVLGMGGSGIAGDVLRRGRRARSCRCRSWCTRATSVPTSSDATRWCSPSRSRATPRRRSRPRPTRRPAPAHVWSSWRPAASWPGLADEWGAPVVPVADDIPMPRAGHRRGGGPAAGRARADRPVPRRAAVDRRRRRPAAARGATSWSPTDSPAARLARRSAARMPIVYGGGGARRVAAAALEEPGQRERQGRRRSRTGIPELSPQRDLRLGPARRRHPPGVHAASLLRHDFEHPQVQRRFDLVDRGPATRSSPASHEVQAEGDGPLAQLLDLVLFGDFVTLHLAQDEGLDPGPVPVLDDLKARLRQG